MMPGRFVLSVLVIILISESIIATATNNFSESVDVYSDPVSALEGLPEPVQDPKLCSLCTEIAYPEPGFVPIRGVKGSGKNQTILLDIYLNLSQDRDIEELSPYIKELKGIREGMIEAEVYADDLLEIRNISFVAYMDIPISIQPTSPINQSDLIAVMGLEKLIHQENITGDGVFVTVMDYNFYMNNLTRSYLTKNTTLISNMYYLNDQVHGTACSEVVSQLAPGAGLYLVDIGGTRVQFTDSLNEFMAGGSEVDIISCSVDFPVGSGIFNVEDDLSRSIKEVTDSGVFWVNAAGNQAQRHWSGQFNDSDGDGYHDFSPEDPSLNISAERGDIITVHLSWDDWVDGDYGYSTQDYDLYMISPNKKKYSSKNPQLGVIGQKPIEVAIMVAPMDGIYQVFIKEKNASRNAQFHLFIDKPHELDEYQVNSSSVGPIASLPEVITVGAINASTMELEPYSSQGPTFDGRLKPELVAPTNIRTVSYFPGYFDGTSAATPCVAACLALSLEKMRGDGREGDEIEDLLFSNAVDLGPTGPDNQYGYGLVSLKFLQ